MTATLSQFHRRWSPRWLLPARSTWSGWTTWWTASPTQTHSTQSTTGASPWSVQFLEPPRVTSCVCDWIGWVAPSVYIVSLLPLRAGIQCNRDCIYDRRISDFVIDYTVIYKNFGSWDMSEKQIIIILILLNPGPGLCDPKGRQLWNNKRKCHAHNQNFRSKHLTYDLNEWVYDLRIMDQICILCSVTHANQGLLIPSHKYPKSSPPTWHSTSCGCDLWTWLKNVPNFPGVCLRVSLLGRVLHQMEKDRVGNHQK